MAVKSCLYVFAAMAVVLAIVSAAPRRPRFEVEDDSDTDISTEAPMNCDAWTADKMKEYNVSFLQLAQMIMESESTELPFEFIMYCLMDDSPLADRPAMLRSEIAKLKEAKNFAAKA